jgi:hypothetical protein
MAGIVTAESPAAADVRKRRRLNSPARFPPAAQ